MVVLVIFAFYRKFLVKYFKKGEKIAGFKGSVLGNSMPLLGQTFKEKVIKYKKNRVKPFLNFIQKGTAGC